MKIYLATLMVCVAFNINAAETIQQRVDNTALGDNNELSAQDHKRKYLRYLSESLLSTQEPTTNEELSIVALFEFAELAFLVKDYNKAEELSADVINRLQAYETTASQQLKDALLLNYKSNLLKELPINAKSTKAKAGEYKQLAPTILKRLLKYSRQYFEQSMHNQTLENLALFFYELPIFPTELDSSLWPLQTKDFRANYTKVVTFLTLNGRYKYKTSSKILQKLASTPEYNFSEPMKAFYYLGVNALIKHRFTLAEDYFEKVLSYSTPKNSKSLYQYMARDYLYHLHWRKGDKLGANVYWLQFDDSLPTLVFQPELQISEDINLKEVEGAKVQLTLSVDREGYIQDVELLNPRSDRELQVLKLVKSMMLKSRFSPVRDEKGSLIESNIKLIMQLGPDLKTAKERKAGRLERTLAAFYPGSSRNRSFFVQSVLR